MTATNHVVTGALIGVTVHQPLLAIPLAFCAHFVLDGLPHFGNHPKFDHTSNNFARLLAADALAALIVLVLIVTSGRTDALWLVLAGMACASPDLMWIRYYIADLRHKPLQKGIIARFHSRIQWGEFPKGYLVEAAWFVVFGALLWQNLYI